MRNFLLFLGVFIGLHLFAQTAKKTTSSVNQKKTTTSNTTKKIANKSNYEIKPITLEPAASKTSKPKSKKVIIDKPLDANSVAQIKKYKTTLKGVWITADDEDTRITITNNKFIEGYKNLPIQDTFNFEIDNIPCNGEVWDDINGWFIKKTNKYGLDDCYKIVSIDSTKFTIVDFKNTKIDYVKYVAQKKYKSAAKPIAKKATSATNKKTTAKPSAHKKAIAKK